MLSCRLQATRAPADTVHGHHVQHHATEAHDLNRVLQVASGTPKNATLKLVVDLIVTHALVLSIPQQAYNLALTASSHTLSKQTSRAGKRLVRCVARARDQTVTIPNVKPARQTSTVSMGCVT